MIPAIAPGIGHSHQQREGSMRLVALRAIGRHGLACAVAGMLSFGPMVEVSWAQDAAQPAIASGGETVLLRETPSYDAMVLAPLSDGSALDVTGAPITADDGTSWLPVASGGQSGYVPAGYVASAPASMADSAAPAPAPVAASSISASIPAQPESVSPVANPAPVVRSTGAATIVNANLRAEPDEQGAILTVLPANTTVSVDGEPVAGFVPITANGVSGWMAVELLAQNAVYTTPATDAAVAPKPAATDSPDAAPAPAPTASPEPVDAAPKEVDATSTGIAWPFSGGEWEVVQGYNNGTHTNRSNFAQYEYALDWARSDGKTAGETAYAPVSGTIQWVDRGSGGMLIDAGNGYGVAVFHVTLDRSLSSGGQIAQGQRIGKISGPGGDGYQSMAHIDITCWRLKRGGNHEATPFTGPNAIGGQEFPDVGGANQYMGYTVSP
jgi:hypothetical protein